MAAGEAPLPLEMGRGPVEAFFAPFFAAFFAGLRGAGLLAVLRFDFLAMARVPLEGGCQLMFSVGLARPCRTEARAACFSTLSTSASRALRIGVLPAMRGRGLYTAMLSHRIAEAKSRGYRWITIDAAPMSRPILLKKGFMHVCWTYPMIHAAPTD